jgi:hypothetical protein
MEDLIAFRVVNGEGESYFFMTWGRVVDSVDPAPLFRAVRPHLTKFHGIDRVRSMHMCRSLQEASRTRYFFEALFTFASEGIPFGVKTYPRWRAKVRRRIAQGKEIDWRGPA